MSETQELQVNRRHVRARVAAARHGVSVSWLWGMVASGRITPPRKIGARISLFDVDQLDRDIEGLLGKSNGSQP
jgi:predicted DNA-binding transcriptional regulator AlpA